MVKYGKGAGRKKKGGGGGRGGGKGRGRGPGKKKINDRKARAFGEVDEVGKEEPIAKRGKKGMPSKSGNKKLAVDSLESTFGLDPAPETDQQASRRMRPGFGQLLESFGVDRDDSEEEDDDMEEDGESEIEGVEGANGEASEGEEGGVDNKKVEGPDVDNVKEAIDETGEADVDEDESEDGEKDGEEHGEKEGETGVQPMEDLDYFPGFWVDPPVPLGDCSETTDSKAEEVGDAVREFFVLPELPRCEAHRRRVGGLKEHLQSATAASNVWRRCKLWPKMHKLFEDFLRKNQLSVGPQEGALFLFLHAYLDVAFPQQLHSNARLVHAMCMLHIVSHTLKATREVLRNTDNSREASEAGTSVETAQDQGFTRARVLVLCPFRSFAYELINMFIAFCPCKKQVVNRQRYEDEFGPGEGEDTKENRWPSWRKHLFAGNNDDNFRVGLAVTRKSVKLYSPFRNSDVLFASPLGLRQITGAKGESKREFDFLSSIEVCLVVRADVLRMQNWEHVQEVMDVVNEKPRSLANMDISRLRPAFADGQARSFRQTIVTSAGQCLDADILFHRSSDSKVGHDQSDRDGSLAARLRSGGRKQKQWKLGDKIDEEEGDEGMQAELPLGLLGKTRAPQFMQHSRRGFAKLVATFDGEPLRHATALGVAKQFFLHAPCTSLQDQTDQLFSTFLARYWKPLGSGLERLLIVCNSYFSFLRLRRFFREENASFCTAFEYSKGGEVYRARRLFLDGDRRVLLVTERFLWYRLIKLKGADYVLFYGCPECPEVYEEVLDNVRTPSSCNSMCLFTRPDAFALERVVGHERACRMLTSDPGKVFIFS